ncbi:MAG: hypothetical protein R3E09_10705 [Novosphingobium sp.]|nr:hypothetical protein [Novosphingobium sp.]
MSTRTSSLLLLALALAGCKPAQDGAAAVMDEPREEVKKEDLGPNQIACALDGLEVFADICSVQQSKQDGTLYLVVRHPDGGFRRFEVLTDGHGLATADGSEVAETMLDDGMLEVAVGEDHYLFPATIKSDAPSP